VALKPITWDEARTHYSALGDRLYSGELPGNVARAIRSVRDVLDEQLSSAAAKSGQGKVYSQLKSDWSDFENDWKDMSSITTKGGSPLARARMAPNSATLVPQVIGKTGDLLLGRLAKYKDAGASLPLAEGVRKLSGQIEGLPKVRVPKAPGNLELPEAPTAKPVPPVDPVAIRRARLLERAGRPMSWWDLLFPPAGIEHIALKNPAILEWIAKQPRKEITPP
jgi:hypothetical protein